MKCPYRNFEECIVEQCPSCNYKTEEYTTIEGRAPLYMSLEEAFKQGYKWESKKKRYQFISCKLVDNSVQPMLKEETHIHNTTNTIVGVKHSIF